MKIVTTIVVRRADTFFNDSDNSLTSAHTLIRGVWLGWVYWRCESGLR